MSIKDIGAGMVPSYHSTESKDEARLVVLTARVNELEAENEKLRDALRALMMGTYAELCTERDASQCRECSMRGESDDSCLVADACEVLGIDMYGEPLGMEVI